MNSVLWENFFFVWSRLDLGSFGFFIDLYAA
jgi:hypothetical protein